MATLTPHMEALPEAQRELWPALRPAANLGFALYGGTAVSLRFGHRQSLDFDFFSDRPLDRPAMEREFSWLVNAEVLQDAPNTLTVLGVTIYRTRPHQPKSSYRYAAASHLGGLRTPM